MKVIQLSFRWFGAVAFTSWPFIFLTKDFLGMSETDRRCVMQHEQIHIAQQQRWVVYGLGVGLLVYHFLYMLCLPFYWNYWRRKWETEAYSQADGMSLEEINDMLRRAPYWLKK